MGAVLLGVQEAWKILKPFWKQIAIGAAVVALALYIHHLWTASMDAAYKRGVDATLSAQEKVLAEREKMNQEIQTELKISATKKEAELEGKLRENVLVVDDLRNQLRAHRVCTDEPSGRALSRDPAPSSESDGAPGDAGPLKPAEESAISLENPDPSVGDDLALIGGACQINTDKLIALQGYVNDLMAQLTRAARATRKSYAVRTR